jgi:ribosomal-protein-alanine N-acetyltransferase
MDEYLTSSYGFINQHSAILNQQSDLKSKIRMPPLNTPFLFPHLETDRLLLRELTPADRQAVFDIYCDERVTGQLEIETLKQPYEAAELISTWAELFEHKQGIRWGVFTREDDCLAGTCGFDAWLPAQVGDLGFDLGRACWGKGLMAEALQVVLSYGFEDVGLNRVQALVPPENERTTRLLARLGFHREGLLRESGYWKGRYWDQICYSLLRKEWNPISLDGQIEA